MGFRKLIRTMSRYGGSGPPAIEGMSSLKVDNLTYRTTPEDLRQAFEKYGEVGDVYIPRDRFTRESRGFAFVRYYDKRDAEDAMDSMDGAQLDGREVRCQMARYGRPSEPSGGGGRDRRSGGGGGRDRGRDGGRRGRSYSRSRSRSPKRRGGRDRDRSNSRSRSRNRSRSPVQQKRSRSKSYDRNGGDASD